MSSDKKIRIRREIQNPTASTDKSNNELQETKEDADISDFFKEMTGSSYAETGKLFFEQVLSVIPAGLLNEQASLDVVVAMFLDIKPKDGIEAMLAAQMIAVHLTSMKMASYSSVNSQPLEAVNSAVNNTSKLMRTFVLQLEALQKYRGKSSQTIQVQHVQVNDGGQAIVGNVQGDGGNE